MMLPEMNELLYMTTGFFFFHIVTAEGYYASSVVKLEINFSISFPRARYFPGHNRDHSSW